MCHAGTECETLGRSCIRAPVGTASDRAASSVLSRVKKEHMRVDCFALITWFGRAAVLGGIVKTATGNACNECKILGQLGLIDV